MAYPHALPSMSSSQPAETAADDQMDELIREEIIKAFAGLEESLSNGEDERAIELIQTQGKTILTNVLARMEEDGQLLSASLSEKVEKLAEDQTADLLSAYEERLATLQTANNQARRDLRAEMDNLKALSDEYDELMASSATSGISRDTIVEGALFLVGLTGVGAALNEGLRLALGAGGDLPTLVVNALLGAAGVGVYFQRKSKRDK